MALVKAFQGYVLEGFTEFKEQKHWWYPAKYVRTQITIITWVEAICDEKEAPAIIEKKIQESLNKGNGWGRNFEGWTSYRKYYKPSEIAGYPEGKEAKLRLEYIRDWKMEKILKELDGNLFAILFKELDISKNKTTARAQNIL